MTVLGAQISTTQLVVYIVIGLTVLAIVTALVGRWLVKRGLREPFVVRLINRASGSVVDVIKRPITIAVLDEVVDVLGAGHYTRNIASALEENHQELKAMLAEKIKQDPTTRRIGLVPFHDRIINDTSEVVLRVILDVLMDPRTDELVADMLKYNVVQIRTAVRARATGAGQDPSSSPSVSR